MIPQVTRQIERSTLSELIRGLPLLGLSFTSCVSLHRSHSLDMVLWLTPRSTARVPVASIQPLNGQWLLPDPHWTTSPSLLTTMLRFRSTPRTWVQNCTIWLTVSKNWVHWWPVLSVSCGSLLALRDFGKFLLDPTSLFWEVSVIVIMIILGHNQWHMKGNWYTYKMIQSACL